MVKLIDITVFFKSIFNKKKNKSIEIKPIHIPLELTIYKPSIDTNYLTYCTICDLLHIDGYLYQHCNLCNKCHKKFKLYCNQCNSCYDYRNDNDIILHRKNCLSAYKNS